MYFEERGMLDHIAGALDRVGVKYFKGFLILFKVHRWIM